MTDLTKLRASVERNSSAEQSVITLLTQLSEQIRTANGADDGDAIDAIADQIDKQAQDLATAVLANTPQATTASPQTATGTPAENATGAPTSTSSAPQDQAGGGTGNAAAPDAATPPIEPTA